MKKLFFIVVALQLLFLVGQAVRNEITLRTADVVYLRIAPVDPRSLFMGNYMDLAYDISTLNPKRLAVTGRIGPGATVYVGLRPSKPFAKAVAISKDKPGDSPRGLIWLRGLVTSSWDGVWQIQYGLERYYIPEGKEDEVARMPWTRSGRARQIKVEVAVRSDGVGFIRGITVDGKPLPF